MTKHTPTKTFVAQTAHYKAINDCIKLYRELQKTMELIEEHLRNRFDEIGRLVPCRQTMQGYEPNGLMTPLGSSDCDMILDCDTSIRIILNDSNEIV